VSYSFDILERVWAEEIRPHLPADSRVVMRFEFLLKEIHEANHRVGDQISKDPRVRKLAKLLEDEVALERGREPGQ
jgi:hypothetical protein